MIRNDQIIKYTDNPQGWNQINGDNDDSFSSINNNDSLYYDDNITNLDSFYSVANFGKSSSLFKSIKTKQMDGEFKETIIDYDKLYKQRLQEREDEEKEYYSNFSSNMTDMYGNECDNTESFLSKVDKNSTYNKLADINNKIKNQSKY